METYSEWAKKIFEKSEKTKQSFTELGCSALLAKWEDFVSHAEFEIEESWKSSNLDRVFLCKMFGMTEGLFPIEIEIQIQTPKHARQKGTISFTFDSDGGFETSASFWALLSSESRDLVEMIQGHFEYFLGYVFAIKDLKEEKFRW